jgi:hypothetical protein
MDPNAGNTVKLVCQEAGQFLTCPQHLYHLLGCGCQPLCS